MVGEAGIDGFVDRVAGDAWLVVGDGEGDRSGDGGRVAVEFVAEAVEEAPILSTRPAREASSKCRSPELAATRHDVRYLVTENAQLKERERTSDQCRRGRARTTAPDDAGAAALNAPYRRLVRGGSEA